MGYGTRPHDWKTEELESSNSLSVSLLAWVFFITLHDPTHHR